METQGVSARSARVVGAFLVVLFAASLASAEVTFTTVAPPGGFETAGIVSALAPIHTAMFDPSKPFKEAMNQIYPDLTSQAQVRGADAVIITNIVILAGGNDKFLLVYGTAIRTRGTPRTVGAAQGPGNSSGIVAAPDLPARADLSGAWSGKVLEEGETEPVDLTVNLMSGGAPGEYSGGMILSGRGCEVSISSTGQDGDLITFKTEKTSKLRCMTLSKTTGQIQADGSLDWKIYGGLKGTALKYQGLLVRK